jgi:hypothetical protein
MPSRTRGRPGRASITRDRSPAAPRSATHCSPWAVVTARPPRSTRSRSWTSAGLRHHLHRLRPRRLRHHLRRRLHRRRLHRRRLRHHLRRRHLRRRHHHQGLRLLRSAAASRECSGYGSQPRSGRSEGRTARWAGCAECVQGARCVAASSISRRGPARSGAGASRSAWRSVASRPRYRDTERAVPQGRPSLFLAWLDFLENLKSGAQSCRTSHKL